MPQLHITVLKAGLHNSGSVLPFTRKQWNEKSAASNEINADLLMHVDVYAKCVQSYIFRWMVHILILCIMMNTIHLKPVGKCPRTVKNTCLASVKWYKSYHSLVISFHCRKYKFYSHYFLCALYLLRMIK